MKLRSLATLLALSLGCGGSSSVTDSSVTDSSVTDSSVTGDVAMDATGHDAFFNDVVLGEFPSTTCADYERVDAGSLSTSEINETSGVVESRARPGAFFLHNDSGDTPRFFAVSLSGALLAEYRLPGAAAVDWEDLTLGPCGAGTCVYLGDIGDNPGLRSNVTIYRVDEPTPPESPPSTVTPIELRWTAVTFRYPDRGHNAETLLSDPATGDLYIVTKVVRGPVTVYRAPRETGGVAERVTEMTIPEAAGQLTGGDVRDDGRAMLLRSYARVMIYERGPDTPFAAIFAGAPRTVSSAVEPQGEAVAWRRDGRGYVTVSEGRSVRINAFSCASP